MEHITEDLALALNEADSIIIDSEVRVGKMTFAFYLMKLLFNEKAIVFSPQESYLFNKKLVLLSKQFKQFSDIENHITRYSLHEEWGLLKRQYGYGFLLIEFERIISTSEDKLVIFHKLGDFFEFQDRYEIEGFYKSLVKIVTKHNKKIIFIINNQNQNYKYIHEVSDEFSDISIHIAKNEKHERIVNIKNILSHHEYPQMQFLLNEKFFTLRYRDDRDNGIKERVKNVLIMELGSDLEKMHPDAGNIYDYIFDRPEFHLYHANSFQSILHNIFIKPDVIIILMDRSEDNFETIKAIKKQLSQTIIISIIEQDFVRTEDIQRAYDYGCHELFPRTYLFDKFILAFQKSIQIPFYSDALKKLSDYTNIVDSCVSFKELAELCIENNIFFSIFTIKKNERTKKLKSTMRRLDFICEVEDIIYYMALNTMPDKVNTIFSKQYEKFDEEVDLISICTPLNENMLEKCLSC